MNYEIPALQEVASSTPEPTAAIARAVPSGAERRRRRRVKMDVPVQICGGIGTTDVFEDVCHSIDVSRDGILVATPRGEYQAGQIVSVTFPYSGNAAAMNMAQPARVIRNLLMPDFRFGVALELQNHVGANSNGLHFAAPSPLVNSVRVLVVESDPRMASALQELLHADAYQVVVVENASAALDVLRSEMPDVLLAEVEGGEISGQDLCAIVKMSERLRHIPVIMTTRSAAPSDYAASHLLGAVVCVARPCAPSQLHSVVRMVAPPPTEGSAYSGRFNFKSYVRLT
ncbi:MAG: response regulator [Candidatus Acidiferrales bacterium]